MMRRILLHGLALMAGALLGGPATAVQLGESLTTLGLEEGASDVTLEGRFNVRSAATGLANTDAAAAFDLALQALPAGGEIRLLPGTYDLQSPVTVTAPHVRIVGSAGTILRVDHTDPLAGAFNAQAEGFHLEGVSIQIAASASGRSAVRCTGADALVRACRFSTSPGFFVSQRAYVEFSANADDSSAVGNRFGGTPIAVQGDLIHVRGIGVDGLRIADNDFSGPDPYCRSAIRLASTTGHIVSENHFSDLREWIAGMGALLRLEVTNAGVVYGNTIESCRFARLAHVTGVRSMPGGVFAGNVLSDPDGAAAWGVQDKTGGLVVHGNQFEGFGAAGRAPLMLDGAVPAVVSMNTFEAGAGAQVEGGGGPTLVVGNQFRTEAGGSPGAPAIDLFGANGGHLLYGNAAHAAPGAAWSCPVFQLSPSGLSSFQAEDNWTPDCEPGKPLCFGDGSEADCPCGNDADVSGEGCKHSGGVGIRISGSGSTSIAADDLSLTCSQLPLVNSGIFYVGTESRAPGVPLFDGMSGNLLYSGLQCAGGSVLRMRGIFQSQGTITDTGFVAQDPSGVYFQPGTTYYFQFWTRDSFAANPCVAVQRANFSPSYAVCMTP